MLRPVAAFEVRYLVRNPLFLATFAAFFLASFFDMAIFKLVQEAGGTVLFNSPNAIIKTHLIASLLYLFVGAAFISNALLRDRQTGYAPILLTTRVSKADVLLGRLAGAIVAGAAVLAAVSLGTWLGTLMPFADQAMLGPNRLSGWAFGYLFFAFPNAIIISAILFALTGATRSTAGTFIGVVLLLVFYLVGQRLMENAPDLISLRVLADPFGMSGYMAGARYLTAPELNAGIVPVTPLMIGSRLLWLAIAAVLITMTVRMHRMAEPNVSARRLRKLARASQAPSTRPDRVAEAVLPSATFDRRTARRQFAARVRMDARHVLKSPVFVVLLLIAFAFAIPGLLSASTFAGTPLYPLTSILVPILNASFRTFLVIVAAYFAGELVWRDRERHIDQLIDAAPVPSWSLMLPKFLGLALVLLSTLAVTVLVAMLVQFASGAVPIRPGEYLRWYVLPTGADLLLVAALAIFVQALSPGKYAGWGVMAVYVVLLFVGPAIGLAHPLAFYGQVPGVPLADMTGSGSFGAAAWWVRLFWAAIAGLMLVAAQLLWPRGIAGGMRTKLRLLPRRWTGPARAMTLSLLGMAGLSGAWIFYNGHILNRYETTAQSEDYLADYERRYLRYASRPQPVVTHLALSVDLFPDQPRADVGGTLRFENKSGQPIRDLHVRVANAGLELLAADVAGARLVHDDRRFGYRIFRFDRPMLPDATGTLTFRGRRGRAGFVLSGQERALVENGTVLDAFDLIPRIGMHDSGLLTDPAARKRQGLDPARPLPALESRRAVDTLMSDNGWITADLTVSTAADQTPVAPGRRVWDRKAHGRRVARFVSDVPTFNDVSFHSGRFALASLMHGGVKFAVYHHPEHRWNVRRMLDAMTRSVDYYRSAFGPYQFDRLQIVENPYGEGAHAYPHTLSMGEAGGFAMDLRDPSQLDIATMLVAHETAHQWWGHQLRGTRMEGTALLIETLAQYSALMVLEKTKGPDQVQRFLRFQRDRYLAGRRAQVGAEPPLVRVAPGDNHITYGKGALAMYLLRQQMGEAVVNRALRGLLARHRFSVPPYPRSLDLVAALRAEAQLPQQQELITDVFERVTLYDFKIDGVTSARRPDGQWTTVVTVKAAKAFVGGDGIARTAPLDAIVPIALLSMHPEEAVARSAVLRQSTQRLRSGEQKVRFVTARRPAYVAVDPSAFMSTGRSTTIC
ncbi:aminopeptidase [Sphingomonas rhizophila]|uniref:Aminopeptidase n=1 Tax=Sphingomonas rhizophila TaxID=2071607 RepID=A0A7G9SC26_9SPHN|nr:M1 family aminopeptidase [Sphingomonas rhizophila]QNN65401.1 aminopeptidase [Sphingomonas rhizophila]